jgi:hypothetical protein
VWWLAPTARRRSRSPESSLSRVVLLVLVFVPSIASAQTVEIEIEEDDAEVVVEAPAQEPSTDSAVPSSVVDALRAELEALRSRIEELEQGEPEVEEPPPPPRASSLLPEWLSLTAYVQAQYEWSDLSEDELLQGGVVMNRDRFSVRRGRVRVAGQWEHFGLEVELDGSTTRGPFFGLRRTQVTARYPNPTEGLPPFVQVAVGLTEIPFGYELRQSQRDWLFMERSLGSLAFFRGPIDAGVRVSGGVGPVRYDVAVMGGTPYDDRAGQTFALDPTAAPDLVGRVGAEMDPDPSFALAGGVSLLWGTGFHPGEDAVKGRLEWRDLNESGTLDTGEIIAIPGRAATPSETFERWAVNVDASTAFRTPIGWTRLAVEATIAQNLDRSLFVADPVALGLDMREISAYALVTQEIFDIGIVGFRYDYYEPNSDLFDQRRGVAVPADASIHTLSPLVGVRLPDELMPGFRARAVFQYDVILDALGRDSRGVPADLANDQFTVRIQGELR